MTASATSWLPLGPCRWISSHRKSPLSSTNPPGPASCSKRGTFVLNVPCVDQADIVQTVGNTSGLEITQTQGQDKFQAYGLQTFAGEQVEAPLLDGCVAWLECRLLPEPRNHEQYDLFLAEVIAAHADERVFSDGRWHFEGHDGLRTLHHVAGGHFLKIGDAVDGKTLAV